MAQKFRKKPVVVEAIQYRGLSSIERIMEAFPDIKLKTEAGWLQVYNDLEIGWINVPALHWIIRGIRGEYYPHDPNIFSEVYEEVTE